MIGASANLNTRTSLLKSLPRFPALLRSHRYAYYIEAEGTCRCHLAAVVRAKHETDLVTLLEEQGACEMDRIERFDDGWHWLTGSSQDRGGQPDRPNRALRRGDRLVRVGQSVIIERARQAETVERPPRLDAHDFARIRAVPRTPFW